MNSNKSVQITLNIKKMYVLVLILFFSVISLHFALIIGGVYTPLSHTLNNAKWISGITYEFLPMALMIFILFLSKLDNIEIKNTEHYSTFKIGAIISIAVLSAVLVFRAMDFVMMIVFSSTIYAREMMLRFSELSFHILFYNLLSVILIIITALFFGKSGLKKFLPVMIIPAFYSLNADLIMGSNKFPALSFFKPLYQSIIEFGKMETMFIGSFLNFLNFKVFVSTQTFPFTLIMGGIIYLVDLPCIGWEGIMAYTIIFINLLVDIEKSNKKRLIWGVLGLLGTIFINILRLTIIFIIGTLYDVQVALIIHQHLGDIIFVVWIFIFLFVISEYKKSKFGRIFEKLKSLLNLK